MEHRRESRLKTDTPVTVTVLGITAQSPMAGRVVDMSGSGLRLNLPLPIPCGASVQVTSKGIQAFGEVARCEPLGGGYSVAVAVSQVG